MVHPCGRYIHRTILIKISAQGRYVRHASPLKIDRVSESIPSESLLYTCKDHLMDDIVIFKLDFRLCRMDIHVHGLRINLKIKEISRCSAIRNQVLECPHHGLVKIWASEISPIYEQILVTESLSCRLRLSYKTIDRNHRSIGRDIHQIIHHTGTQYILDSELQ